MNPQDHAGRAASPFIEFAESADIGTEVLVHPSSYVTAAATVANTGPMPSVLPVRHRRMSWAARQWAKLTPPADPTPMYSRLDRHDGLGR